MKKIITMLLVLALCVAVFAACGEGEGASENKTPEKTTLTVIINNGIKETKGEYEKGTVIEAPQDPIRNGYIFEGWFVGETQITFPYTINEAVTITAKMTAEPAVPVELEEQPEDMEIAVGDRKGPYVTPTEVRGYEYTYQWYKNTTDSTEGGTPIEGATTNTCTIPSSEYNAGDVLYVYCEVTGTRNSNGATAKTVSDTAKISILAGKKNILFVGSAYLTWTALKNDTTTYVENMLNVTAKDEYSIDRFIRNGSTYCIFESGFSGVDQVDIKTKTEEKVYDYVILQLSRDYVLSYDTTREKELKAIENITNYAKAANPNCKIILYLPPWRTDVGSEKWNGAYGESAIATVDDAKAALQDYYNNFVRTANPDALYCDMYAGFEKLIAAGINPYGAGSVGQVYPNADASYLAACMIYNLITGKSSEGLEVYSTTASAVDPTLAAQMQKMATELLAK
ncbi:MAG: InlB B-repeat-containing protein [Clostridia bacterium]|nr:InlB B-repeat-containing protein [Clostridia bacterium]MBR2472470.1 InlB B-repeat-containing protein [Clostridia bacterium]